MKLVSNYISELLTLSSDGMFRIFHIEWWLLKYEDEYKRLYKIEQSKYLYEFDGEIVRLPDYIGCRTDEEKFIKTFEKLNELSDLHRDEVYFKDELEFYNSIKNDSNKVKEWIKKNEFLGSTKYVCFLTDYFGDKDESFEDLEISLFDNKTIKVYRKDFKYTIDFIHLFDDLYWKRKSNNSG